MDTEKYQEKYCWGKKDILTVSHRLLINYKGEKEVDITLTKYSNLVWDKLTAHASWCVLQWNTESSMYYFTQTTQCMISSM